jgi:hypothetical protein
MKKIYQEISVEILYLTTADIVTFSDNWYDDVENDWFD